MSGFDTSQPITDDKALKDGGLQDQAAETAAAAQESADGDELGDATPGPR